MSSFEETPKSHYLFHQQVIIKLIQTLPPWPNVIETRSFMTCGAFFTPSLLIPCVFNGFSTKTLQYSSGQKHFNSWEDLYCSLYHFQQTSATIRGVPELRRVFLVSSRVSYFAILNGRATEGGNVKEGEMLLVFVFPTAPCVSLVSSRSHF